MATQASMIMTDNGLSFVIDFKPYSCTEDHPNYNAIVAAAKDGDFDAIPALISPKAAVERVVQTDNYASSVIEVTDTGVLYKGEYIHGAIVERIIDMNRQGFNIVPMVRFLENLYQNPSRTAVLELYNFLVKAELPITEDGHFLAYKRVRDDYLSCHDGKTDNSIGTRLFMERFKVDDNRNNTCSHGFHFCSYDYLQHFSGSRTVILKINPRDVVAIPSDYSDTKGRANEYLVIGEVDHQQVKERNLLGEAGSVVRDITDIPDHVPPVTDEVLQVNPGDAVAISADHPFQPPIGATPPVPTALPSGNATILGYDDGYRAGRYGTQIAYRSFLDGNADRAYNEARDEGFSDGRKHKVRKHKAPGRSNYE